MSHAGGSETTSDAARNTVTRTGPSIAKRFHTFSFQASGDVCACVCLCQCVARQSHARTLAYDGEGDASVTLNETPQLPISVFVSVRGAMEPCTHLHVRRCLSSPASQKSSQKCRAVEPRICRHEKQVMRNTCVYESNVPGCVCRRGWYVMMLSVCDYIMWI